MHVCRYESFFPQRLFPHAYNGGEGIDNQPLCLLVVFLSLCVCVLPYLRYCSLPYLTVADPAPAECHLHIGLYFHPNASLSHFRIVTVSVGFLLYS